MKPDPMNTLIVAVAALIVATYGVALVMMAVRSCESDRARVELQEQGGKCR